MIEFLSTQSDHGAMVIQCSLVCRSCSCAVQLLYLEMTNVKIMMVTSKYCSYKIEMMMML